MTDNLKTKQLPLFSQKKGLNWLIIAALITVVLWQLPAGHYILYPFSILATWFHEMGHGLIALLFGGKFDQLILFPDGSGLALHSTPVKLSAAGRASIAAGGPLGPPIAGALFILAGRHYKTAHYGLILLGVLLIASVLIWVRSAFGMVVISALSIVILGIAFKAEAWLQTFTIQFLGVQACVSTYHQMDYLFIYSVTIDSQQMLSDTGHIAEQMWLPYWFWGIVIILISLGMLFLSLRLAYR